MLPLSANLELLTSWGRVEQLSGSPGSKRDRLCPGLLLARDKRSTIWISCLGSLSSATPLVRAPEPQSHSTDQLWEQLVNHKESGISAGQRTPALGNFLAESLFLQSQGKGKPLAPSPGENQCKASVVSPIMAERPRAHRCYFSYQLHPELRVEMAIRTGGGRLGRSFHKEKAL